MESLIIKKNIIFIHLLLNIVTSQIQSTILYDQYVEKAIMNLRKDNYIQFPNQEYLKNPQAFRDIIYQIIQKFELEDYQKADRALWRYGQHLSGEWIIAGIVEMRHNPSLIRIASMLD